MNSIAFLNGRTAAVRQYYHTYGVRYYTVLSVLIIPLRVISFDVFLVTFHGKIVILGSRPRAAPVVTI